MEHPMASTPEVTIRLAPDTADLATALEIIAKHAQACAADLRQANLRTPTMAYAADQIHDAAAAAVGGEVAR
jgi:hypothetical protein